ncbi:uncharacterized protein LOC141680985 [Apium graveolens]|uniref:uncharacterized protein LOC141680985 n=1 Tax=Apium graveolens TaxID=4045 RepID=UPI003D7BB5A0
MEGSNKGAKHGEQTKVIPPRELRLDWFMSTFKNKDKLLKDDEDDYYYDPVDDSHSLTFRDFASFELDMYESEGFDVQDYTKVNDAGMIRTYYDLAAGINLDAESLPEITECAQQSIEQYNADKGTHFELKTVTKTNVEPVCPYRFYITFDAIDGTKGIKETFQAVVDVHIPPTNRTVTMVRISQPPRYFLLEDIPKYMADQEDMSD